MTRRPFQSRARVVVTVETRDALRRIAKSRGETMSAVLDALLSNLPPTPREVELRRLAADPSFAAGTEPAAPIRNRSPRRKK